MTLELDCFPPGHILQRPRFCPRNSCFVSRRARCARSVPAYLIECVLYDEGVAAVFFVLEYRQAAGAAAGRAAAAAAALPPVKTVKSKRNSSSLTDGSAMTPAAFHRLPQTL